ncbi:MAG: efflux RND transporter periplasmic adaptor subunit [Candidatus Scalinduaceae bacterium]
MNNMSMTNLYSNRNNSKLKYFSLCIIVLIFNIVVTLLICNKVFAQKEMFVAPVVVSRIVQMDVPQPVKMVGTVFPFRESIVASEIEGLVEEFPVKRGDYVKKGQVLAKLRTRSLEIQLKGAKADEHLALIEYERAKELYEGDAISHSELDEFETKLIAQEAEVEAIEDNIGKCTITAPFDGKITEEHTEVGQWLDKGDEVVSMIELDYVKVRVPVPEKYIQDLKIGDECNVSFLALGGLTKTGSIIHIVPQANARSRTFPVYVKLDNKDEMVKSGMFAEATFEIGPLLSATMILKDSIVRRAGGKLIFLAVEGKAVVVPVQMGIVYKNLIQIIGNVKPGVDVIIRGNERLRNGQDVQVIGRIDPDIQHDNIDSPSWTMDSQEMKREERRGVGEEGEWGMNKRRWMKEEGQGMKDEKEK